MNKELAEQLALKKYYKAVLNDLLTEQNAIHAYLKKIKEPSGIKVLQHPEYGRLLESHFKPISKELSDWADEPYEKNLTHPEHLLHKSSSNIPVRSKSESLIASSLYSHQIPFRYECSLRLRDLNLHEALFYPDFTIRHPKNGKTYYWEHFGLMDQEAYAKNAGKKLQIYIANGIIPSIQLITTYETKENPLNIMMVEDVIRQYFL